MEQALDAFFTWHRTLCILTYVLWGIKSSEVIHWLFLVIRLYMYCISSDICSVTFIYTAYTENLQNYN